jgi:hypothetical protein
VTGPGGELDRQLGYFGADADYRAYRELARAVWPVLEIVKGRLRESPAGGRLREILGDVLDDGVVPEHLVYSVKDYWSLVVFGLLDFEDGGTGTLMERYAGVSPDETKRRWHVGDPGPPRFFPIPPHLRGNNWILPLPPDEVGTERDLLLRYGAIHFVPVNDMFFSSARAIRAITRLLDDEPATRRPGASAAGRGTGGTDPAPAPGYLGLVVDDENRRVTRQGRNGSAEFEGKALAWALFRAFWNNREKYTTLDQIRAIWGAAAITNDPDPNYIQVEISRLRRLLKPIDISVRNGRGLGYRLIDLPVAPQEP